MIFGNIHNTGEYAFLPENVQKCFAYAREHNLLSYGKGSHEIEGKELFFNRTEYMTTEPEARFWEAHREYLDVHLILSGTERIDVNLPATLRQGVMWSRMISCPWRGRKTLLWCSGRGIFSSAILVTGT